MRVDQIWRYPVKSMAGEQLAETVVDISGIPGDRALYVVDANGRILSARNNQGLLGLHATIGDDGGVLVDGVPWREPAVAERVRAAAGGDARIVAADGPERFDILPLLVVTDGTVEEFGHDLRRLRPNIVISGVEGLAERGWQGAMLSIGDAVIALADLRARCIMTTWDPDTQEQDIGVFLEIRDRFAGKLALNAWAGREGRIAVGDEVRLLESPVEVELPYVGRFA
jgi:uncharacterized protein